MKSKQIPILFGLEIVNTSFVRPRKVDFLFLRHFFEKTNARGRNKNFIVSDFFLVSQ